MKELWHSMDHKGKELHNISGSLKVQNFVVPVVSEERRALYERVAMQRRLEMREIKESFRTTSWPLPAAQRVHFGMSCSADIHPLGHVSHISLILNFPAGQAEHDAVPFLENRPFLHCTHAVAL